ncbi:hypothetical protein PRZ48_004347 [Zasmidium cellare]|uniref:Methyltransferase domain-containing protein n=1 Tax=Zasmidium cellare TaxID=395010 RepID=A0ABR0EP95_ZASCE|nr:hypothetical protein PRZ48_004347 [Zasmidium cellare]
MSTDTVNSDNIFDIDSSFWTNYEKGRPSIPDSFFNRILQYHQAHAGGWETLHDAGAGPAVHTSRLSQPFARVLISDVLEQNIAAAKSRLQGTEVHHHTAKLEDASWIPPGSIDLLFAASCMHLVSLPQALAAIAAQLRPGGTLAVACMGYPFFEDERVQKAWYEMFQTANDKGWIRAMLQAGGQKGEAGLEHLACIANGYDSIALPTSIFEEGARRYKINTPEDWWYRMHVARKNESVVPRRNRIGETEEIVVQEEEGWGFEVTLEGMRDQAATFPIWGDGDGFEGYWDEISEILEDGTVKGWWPHVLILATKR